MPRLLTAAENRPQGWVNGNGRTCEVVRVPDTDDWDWRLSIAQSSEPAPFSHLGGIDRMLMLLKGARLELQFTDGQVAELSKPFDFVEFAGEHRVIGNPLDGSTEQLNLMWRRDRVDMDTVHLVSDDERLVRNRAGTARSRSADEPVEALEIEAAIARNVRALRTNRGLSIQELALKVGISKAMLSKVENNQTSCSLSTLAALARGLDVPVTSLFRGADVERPASFVKAGRGTKIVRDGSQVGHDYELLGTLRGEHKRLECLMVTLTEKSETYPLFQHPGTEFIYMLEGKMDYGHGRTTYRLTPGDSLQFDGEGAHGPVALVQVPIRFLSVVAFPDAAV